MEDAATIMDDPFAGGAVDSDEIAGTAVVPTAGMAVILAKAEIDQQVATAKQYPRSLKRVAANILTLATMDERAAEECMYSLPRGGKPICGPSIRLAEIIASQWGNCRVAARLTDVDRDNKRVEAQGMFWDLESNVGQVATVHRRIVDKRGRIFNDDMILVTSNAACSIARRNAILMGVPKAVWRKAYDAAVAVIKGDVKTLAERKTKVYQSFAAFGVKPEQIYAVLGIAGDEEVTIDHMPDLVGMYQSLKSGESTVEQMFKRAAAPFDKVANPLAEDTGDKPADAGETVDSETGEVKGAGATGPADQGGGRTATDASSAPGTPAAQPKVASEAPSTEAAAAPVTSDPPSSSPAGINLFTE